MIRTNEYYVIATATPELRKAVDELENYLKDLDPSIAWEARIKLAGISGIVKYMENNMESEDDKAS